ncbi:MAG: hypothetical protein QOD57_3091 [Actinomycetota bacterium]|jgi:hypothetical protein|nr:hypothetical protein [Actinomycetota bacterium]
MKAKVAPAGPFTVSLADEDSNGAACLVHMLLSQQADGDTTGRFAREAARLRPVKLVLTDTQEACAVVAGPGGLTVTDRVDGRYATAIEAASRHLLDVPQLRLAGRFLITGPLRGPRLWSLLRDIAARRVVIGGLLRHYANTMRFLWLINVRGR